MGYRFIFSYLVRYAIRRDVDRLQAKFALLDNQDLQLLALLGLTDYRPPAFVDDRSYSVRMSRRLGQCLSQVHPAIIHSLSGQLLAL